MEPWATKTQTVAGRGYEMLSDTFITESYCDALYPNPERLGRALVLDGGSGGEHVVGVDCIKSREHGTCFKT